MTTTCPFCEIVAGRAPAEFVGSWDDALAFTPLNPVIDGHTLVVPRVHVADYVEAPEVTAAVMRRAAEFMRWTTLASNLITSKGAAATQTVHHLHVHIVPRVEGDVLALPWSNQIGGKS